MEGGRPRSWVSAAPEEPPTRNPRDIRPKALCVVVFQTRTHCG